MENFNIEDIDLNDLKSLSEEEKSAVQIQIEDICQQANKIEDDIGESGNKSEYGRVLQKAFQLRDKALRVKQKLNLSTGSNLADVPIPTSSNQTDYSNCTKKESFEQETDPFLSWVQSVFCKKVKDGEMKLHNLSIVSDEESFISNYLEDLELQEVGVFDRKHKNRDTVQYFCERHSKPTGKKKRPLLTIANKCPAYVSFRFIEKNGKKAAIVRQQVKHEGHDQHNIEEKRVSKIDSFLEGYITELVEKEKKSADILVKAVEWSRSHGKNDVRDRQYFPTLVDVKNICYSHKKRKRVHQNDADAVDYLCCNLLKDEIIHYQRLIETCGQPLIIVYQNDQQRSRMVTMGSTVVFLDATYKGVTSYGYAFYCMIVRDGSGRGTPVAYMVTSEDTSSSLEIFLRCLVDSASKRGFLFNPRSFMVDRDMKEIGAIKKVFLHCQVLLCWFHVLQAVYRWLNKKDSGVSGNENAQTRKDVVQYLRQMRKCTQKNEFDKMADNLAQEMPTQAVTKYLTQNWITLGEMWSHFGRRFFHEDQDTNNLVERFFLGLKYNFLGGYGNVRVDELLMLLHGNITTFYNYMEDLAKAGRLNNTRQIREARGQKVAEDMLRAGIGNQIQWIDDVQCHVPSQSSTTSQYHVDITKATCTCPASTQGHCKHFHLALLVAINKGICVEESRKTIANGIIQQGFYALDPEDSCLEVYTDDDTSIFNCKTSTCTCLAFSFGIKCICSIVADTVLPDTNLVTDVSEEQNSYETDAVNPQDIIKIKIEEIYRWSVSEQFGSCTGASQKDILKCVNETHSLIFNSKFKKNNRKRKIEKLHKYRKSKPVLIPDEHSYIIPKKQRKIKQSKEDGSFRMSNRKERAVRKPFQ